MTATVPNVTVPGPNSLETFAAESQFAAPGTQGVALFSKLALDRGEGAILWDRDGNRYIDLMAGICVASLGYGHPKYVAALQKQIARLHVGSFATAHRAELVKLIASVTPGDCNRTQFYSSGAEAVEAALRLAKSHTKKSEVIAFWGGYHGKTGGVLPLLGNTFKHDLGPLMPGCYTSPYPSMSRDEFHSSTPQECLQRAMQFLRKKIQVETTNNVAAIIVEPIQGTAGNIVPVPGFLQRAAGKFADESRRPGADRRRDDHRLRPERQALRREPRRHRSRHHDRGQGVRRRLPDERRDRHRESCLLDAMGQSEWFVVELWRQLRLAAAAALAGDLDHARGRPAGTGPTASARRCSP